MCKIFEIYYKDLNQSAKEEILKFYDIESPQEANLDIMPITILEKVGDLIRDHN
jgi:hypothetical protein